MTHANAAAVWINGRAAMVVCRDEMNDRVLVEYPTPTAASPGFRRAWVPSSMIDATHPAHCECGDCPAPRPAALDFWERSDGTVVSGDADAWRHAYDRLSGHPDCPFMVAGLARERIFTAERAGRATLELSAVEASRVKAIVLPAPPDPPDVRASLAAASGSHDRVRALLDGLSEEIPNTAAPPVSGGDHGADHGGDPWTVDCQPCDNGRFVSRFDVCAACGRSVDNHPHARAAIQDGSLAACLHADVSPTHTPSHPAKTIEPPPVSRGDHDEPPALTDLDARKLACDWHGGGGSALYALCSTGAMRQPALSAELGRARYVNGDDAPNAAELRALAAYVDRHGPRGPVAGWSDLPW